MSELSLNGTRSENLSTIYKNILLTYYGSVSELLIRLFHAGTVHLKSVRSNVYNLHDHNVISAIN